MNKKLLSIVLAMVCTLSLVGCKDKVDKKSMELKLTLNRPNKIETRVGVYSGEVDDKGLPDGQGKFEAKNPHGFPWSYEGSFVKGHFDGKGKFYGANKSIHEGTYKNDQLNGEGKITFKDGIVFQGNFTDGKLNSTGKVLNKDGSVKYEGKFYKNFPVDITPDYKGNSVDILNAFVENESAANQKYKNKIIEMTGTIDKIVMPKNIDEKKGLIEDQRLIILENRRNNGRAYVIRAAYDDKELFTSEAFNNLRNGNKVTLKGYFYGNYYLSEHETIFIDLRNPQIIQ